MYRYLARSLPPMPYLIMLGRVYHNSPHVHSFQLLSTVTSVSRTPASLAIWWQASMVNSAKKSRSRDFHLGKVNGVYSRDSSYYFDDGNAVFLVGDVLFKVSLTLFYC
jgi:hypothetical protein